MSSKKCKICDREAVNSSIFCGYHYEAYQNIREAYPVWRERLNISPEEYLILIQKNSYTGRWVREIASYLMKVGNFDI
jgi:hypothetical protein